MSNKGIDTVEDSEDSLPVAEEFSEMQSEKQKDTGNELDPEMDSDSQPVADSVMRMDTNREALEDFRKYIPPEMGEDQLWEKVDKPFFQEMARMYRVLSRRLFSQWQYFSAGYYAIGPVTYLSTATAIGIASTLSALYTTSYRVEIDGVSMGVVSSPQVVTQALAEVREQGESIFGDEFVLNHQIDYDFGLNLKGELSDSSNIETYLYHQLEELGEALGRYAVIFQGVSLGVVETAEDLQQVLDDILADDWNENTISAEFVEEITTERVFEEVSLTLEALKEKLTENTTGETSYTVVSGDTFNGIAYNNDMSMTELSSLNPNVDPDRLYVGNVLQVKETIPLLSVKTVEHVNYIEEIPCPIEEVSDSSQYVGSWKVLETGVTGEADVVADISYLNGRETSREILERVVLREPTVTTHAVGTAERPKTASYGSYIWPTSGYISSYFGARTLYGQYNYHSGLDIAAPYGTPVYAADGGTVTFSGWKTSYGNIIIITHDNGAQTYYAHNSSLLVPSGQKVYRGQLIAKVGSTGNSTGNHLHFEVRIGGKAVNPLGYLP